MNSLNVTKEENKRMTNMTYNQSSSGSARFAGFAIAAIVILIILIQIGFFNTYIKFFPKFNDATVENMGPVHFNWVMHLHGITMMSWILMLLVQPILIRKGMVKLHSQIGRLSYIIAPLVLLFMYLANQDAYHDTLKQAGKFQAVAFVSLTFPGVIFFAVLYALAMQYSHKPYLHMRFMCSTAFLFIPPAVDRALIYFFGLPGFDITSVAIIVLTGTITVIDSVKSKRLSPFALICGFEILHTILWHSRETEFWQATGNVIAKIF